MQRWRKLMVTKKINIIEDVNEFECRSSQAISSGQGATKILWFGHSSNLSYLIDFLEEWDPCSTNLQLVIVSSEVTMRILQDCRFKRPKNIKIQFIRWSVPNLEKAASMCQLCIVPANEKSVKRFASSNWLITALTLGLPTAATPLPSYKEFSKYFIHLNNDNLNRMIINPSTFQSGPERFQKNESKGLGLNIS